MFQANEQLKLSILSLRGRNQPFLLTLFLAFLSFLVPCARAQRKEPVAALTPGLLTIIAGNGTAGYSGDGGPATQAELNDQFGIAIDSAGNIYAADQVNEVVRKITPAGIISTFAGNGAEDHYGDGGPATQAALYLPGGVAVDRSDNVYIVEIAGYVRQVTTAGIISTVAGNGSGTYSGDGGPATAAGLNRPYTTYVDAAGNLYISDTGNNVLRKVTAATGIITTVAGNGYGNAGVLNDYCGSYAGGLGGYSGDGGLATDAELYGPRGVAMDAFGNIYIADTCNNVVRKITVSTGIITTITGNGFGAGGPGYNTGGFSGDGGPATAAELNNPEVVLIDPAGDLYIGDSENYRLRFVNPNQIISTIAGNGPTSPLSNVPANASGMHLEGLAFDSSYNIYISDSHTNQILKVDISKSAFVFPTPTAATVLDATDGYQPFAITNIGNRPLVFDQTQSSPGFLIGSDPVSCGRLEAGSSCPFSVAFDPTANSNGIVNGFVRVSDNSKFRPSSQVIALTGTATPTPPPAATPTFSPASGIYQAGQTVTISDTSPGALIYYTTNGTLPTTSSALYTGPISVNATETINAVAAEANVYLNSAIGTAVYTIASATPPVVNYPLGFPTTGLSLNGAAAILELTDGGLNEAHSFWTATPVNVQTFTTDFTFRILPSPAEPNYLADGFTFTLQNSPAGPTAIGVGGGDLGYAGLYASVAIKFDLYSNAGEGSDSTGFFTNGASPTVPSIDMTPSGVNLHSGDPMHAHITYDGTTLTLVLTDTITNATFTTYAAMNIPLIVTGNTAYAGFTAGAGSFSAIQDILTWTYSH